MADNDDPKVAQIPTRPDELLAAAEAQMKLLRKMVEHSVEIAQARKRMFDSYREAGFSDQQALTLVQGSLY